MDYCEPTDIDVRYGAANVSAWADIDNSEDEEAKTARKAEAISVVSETIDDVLRTTAYHVPCVTSSGTTPTTIKDMAAWMAGLWLYESRGGQELDSEKKPVHRYYYIRVHMEAKLEAIRTDLVKLDALAT